MSWLHTWPHASIVRATCDRGTGWSRHCAVLGQRYAICTRQCGIQCVLQWCVMQWCVLQWFVGKRYAEHVRRRWSGPDTRSHRHTQTECTGGVQAVKTRKKTHNREVDCQLSVVCHECQLPEPNVARCTPRPTPTHRQCT